MYEQTTATPQLAIEPIEMAIGTEPREEKPIPFVDPPSNIGVCRECLKEGQFLTATPWQHDQVGYVVCEDCKTYWVISLDDDPANFVRLNHQKLLEIFKPIVAPLEKVKCPRCVMRRGKRLYFGNTRIDLRAFATPVSVEADVNVEAVLDAVEESFQAMRERINQLHESGELNRIFELGEEDIPF